MRTAILIVAIGFTAMLGFLTLVVLFESGPDVLTLAAVIVLALLGFGAVGALRQPPDG